MVKASNLGWKNTSNILPADTLTDAEIDASMDSGTTPAFTRNDDTNAMGSERYQASAHYMVHS